MKNNDYRRYIIDMINHISSNTALKEIYMFVQNFFCISSIGTTLVVLFVYKDIMQIFFKSSPVFFA